MKKIIFALALFLAGVTASANIEIAIDYYGLPLYQENLTNETVNVNSSLIYSSPAGIKNDFSFFCRTYGLAEKNMTLDFGLNLGFGVDFISSWQYAGQNAVTSGTDSWFVLGPAARLNLNEYHAVSLSIGYRFNYFTTSYITTDYIKGKADVTLKEYSSIINLNVCYRFWLVNKPGYHFGFNVGTDLGIIAGGGGQATIIYRNNKINDKTAIHRNGPGFTTDIYLGACFNFGDRGCDR